MSGLVRITKEGIVAYDWNGEAREYIPDTSGRSNLRNLRVRCELDPDLTLGDLFRAVETDPALMEFISDYSWCPVVEFHRQAELPKSDKEGDLIELTVEAFCEIHEDRFEGISLHFSGLDRQGR